MHRNLLCTAFILAIVQLIALPSSAQTKRIRPNCPMNIVIALDFSGSEQAYLGEIRTVLHALTDIFELDSNNMKMGIITFNRGAEVVLPLTGDTKKLEAAIEALRIPTMVYATDIHAGIELANREFRQRATPGVPKYFVLVSDGDPHAHSRGYGFQADLTNMERLKLGDAEAAVEPVHVFTLYTGRLSPHQDRFNEEVRRASIQHMQVMASDEHSFFFYEQYPLLVDFFERVSSCL